AAATAGIGLAFAAQNDRVQKSFGDLSTRVQGDMRQMSGVFVPVLIHLSDTLGGVFDRAKPRLEKAFAGLAPVAQRMVDGIGGALDGLVPAIDPAVKAATPLLGKLADAMPAVGRAAGRLVVSVAGHMEDLTPKIKSALSRAEQVAKDGASRIGDGISTVLNSDAVQKVKDAWPGIVSTVTDGVTQMATAAKDRAIEIGTGLVGGFQTGISTGNWSDLGRTVGEMIRDQIGRALKIATTITESIGEAIQKVDWIGLGIKMGAEAPSFLAGLVLGIVNFDVAGALHGLGEHWVDVVLGLLAVAALPAKVVGKIGEILARIPIVGTLLRWIVESLSKVSKKAVGAVGDALGFLGRGFMDGFRKVFPSIGASFAEHLELLPTRMGVVALELVDKGKAMVHRLGDAIASGAHWVSSKIGEIIGKIIQPFAKAGGWLLGKGRDIVKGLADGIGSRLSSVAGKLGSIGGKVVGWVGDMGKKLFNAGVDLIMGFVHGISATFGKVKDKLGELTGKLTSWKGPPAKDRTILVGSGQLVIDGFRTGLESRYAAVRASLAGLTGSLTGPDVVGAAVAGVPGRATGAGVGGGAGTGGGQSQPLVVQLVLPSGKVIQEVLLQLKRERGGVALGLG
ncbi:MAG TPA: hypothetical protein VIS06_11710, partial [Mycobacteriales bacterium]